MSLWAKLSEEVLHLDLVRKFIVSNGYHNMGGLPLNLSIK